MFELIGLLFATIFLFTIASILAAILAGITWLLVRNTSAPRKRLMFTAAMIPIASAAYLWLYMALLPGESLFGDISQPLPNGYVLEALGKMPDFASISNPNHPIATTVCQNASVGWLCTAHLLQVSIVIHSEASSPHQTNHISYSIPAMDSIKTCQSSLIYRQHLAILCSSPRSSFFAV